jgi:precorrin-6Y C5,15-methyltransferase (decarboxylating)
MTQGDVRSILIDRLNLAQDSVFWDIGAGTGSVSVAAALEYPEAEVHAVERLGDALSLLERNRAKFRLHNMKIYKDTALSAMDGLPKPTHVFIGGSGGELRDILKKLAGYANVRVSVSAVTLNTLSTAVDILNSAAWRGLEAVQVSVAKSRPLGSAGLLMSACNPVTLLFANSSGNEGMMNR